MDTKNNDFYVIGTVSGYDIKKMAADMVSLYHEKINSVPKKLINGRIAAIENKCNGIYFYATENSTPESVYAEYIFLLRKAEEEYKNSPAGKKEEIKRRKQLIPFEKKRDKLMLKLPNLDFSNYEVLLNWLSKICDPCRNRYVKIDRENIIATFEEKGFDFKFTCSESELNTNPESHAKKIIIYHMGPDPYFITHIKNDISCWKREWIIYRVVSKIKRIFWTKMKGE